MRAFVIGAILAVVLAACLPPPGVLFRTTLTNPDGSYPLPITLGDTTDLVVGVGAAQFDPACLTRVARAIPGLPHAD